VELIFRTTREITLTKRNATLPGVAGSLRPKSALVGRSANATIIIEFLIDRADPQHSAMIKAVENDLNFDILEKRAPSLELYEVSLWEDSERSIKGSLVVSTGATIKGAVAPLLPPPYSLSG